MKTKAYKLRENIARFIYEKLTGKGCRIEVFWDPCACVWLVRTKGFISQELVDEVKHTANFLGVDISLAEPDKLCTKMWNKEKEERWGKKQTVKCSNKTEEFYLVETDTDVFGLYRNLDEAKTLKMHLEIVLGKEVYIRKIN